MNILCVGESVVVEGFEQGVTAEGVAWPIPGRSDGRFCNVFEFRDGLIRRLHIYVDPDFLGAHNEQYLWGLPIAGDVADDAA